MWNVFVVDDYGECRKVNDDPFDAEEVAYCLEMLDSNVRCITLIPAVQPRSD